MNAQAFSDYDQRRRKRGTAPPTGKHRHITKAERERAAKANQLTGSWNDAD